MIPVDDERAGAGVWVTGFLQELEPTWAEPVQYALRVGDVRIPLNTRLGSRLEIRRLRQKACRHCGRRVSKLYQNGYCYPCVTTLAECDRCIIQPHLCHYHEGTCRDESFARRNCMIPHYVYLALSSHVKVGVTRKNRALQRWIDQGAVAALPVAEVPSRKQAGELEAAAAEFLSDRTDWRKMLRGEVEWEDLPVVRDRLRKMLGARFEPFWIDVPAVRLAYPVAGRPPTVRSLSLDRREAVEGVLLGVQGQYLLLDAGVFHVKKHTGYEVAVRFV